LAEEPNYFSHAFKSQYNLIGLGTAIGFALLSGSFLPLLIAAGVEMAVLPLVSGSERFKRLIRARVSDDKDEERQARTDREISEIFRGLPEPERVRYRQLELLAHEIRQNYQGLDSSSRMLLEELEGKLEFLLTFYLRMRHSISRYDRYFATTDPERMQERIVMLDHEIEAGLPRVKEVKSRTKAVLEKRLLRYQKALENKHLIDAQTETVQEVLQLLRDQSFSMRDPRTITEQLDTLLSSAEETERGVRDMEELLSLEQDSYLPGALEEDIESELQAGRTGTPAAATPVQPPLASRLQKIPGPPGPPPPAGKKKLTH
jgi:hypothetical protein